MVRRKHIRGLVNELLARFGMSQAPVPVETIARSLGIAVQRTAAEDDLSGFVYRDRTEKTAVIGVNANHPRNRQNFTVAHELGHYLLHDCEGIHVDRRFHVMLRNPKSSEGTSIEEKEANLFAAELLMPVPFLEQDLAEIDAVDLEDETVIAKLARRYGVSTQAMVFRLGYLGYLRL
jgi:Zn-dependent peptidase ImmA (M78 family)